MLQQIRERIQSLNESPAETACAGKGKQGSKFRIVLTVACRHLELEANMVAALDAVTVDEMRRQNFLFFIIITLCMNLKSSLLGSRDVLNDSP